MNLVVWAEKSDGMMEPVGHVVINKAKLHKGQIIEVAEGVRKENGMAYIQLWDGMECVASAGRPEVT